MHVTLPSVNSNKVGIVVGDLARQMPKRSTDVRPRARTQLPVIIAVYRNAELRRERQLITIPPAHIRGRIGSQAGIGVRTVQRQVEAWNRPRRRSQLDAIALCSRAIDVDAVNSDLREQLDILPYDMEGRSVDAEAMIGGLRLHARFIVGHRVRMEGLQVGRSCRVDYVGAAWSEALGDARIHGRVRIQLVLGRDRVS